MLFPIIGGMGEGGLEIDLIFGNMHKVVALKILLKQWLLYTCFVAELCLQIKAECLQKLACQKTNKNFMHLCVELIIFNKEQENNSFIALF